MSSLFIPQTTDFRFVLLSDITEIEFSNLSGSATAVFLTEQFGGSQISSLVSIRGTDGINRIHVIGSLFGSSFFDASNWSFTNWSPDDHVELVGTDSSNDITGSPASDVLKGKGGNDILNGNGDSNVLMGGAGNDTLISTKYSSENVTFDALYGGAGIDYVSLARFIVFDLDVNISFGGQGKDIGDGTRLFGIERLDIIAGDGDDHLTGGNFDDGLNGNWGDDLLKGGGGNDALNGGPGRDVLYGGDGIDYFFWGSSDESNSRQRDVVADFEQGIDILDLRTIDPIAGGPDNDFKFIGTKGFGGTGIKGELRYHAGANATLVYADLSGDGVSDFEFKIRGHFDLTTDDFWL